MQVPVLFLLLLPSLSHSLTRPPNIVILVVDDLGIGDLGCFGNTSLATPHIDELAQTGAVLSHHVSPAVLCTPSRAALMTGRYAVRMGLTGSQGNYSEKPFSQNRNIFWKSRGIPFIFPLNNSPDCVRAGQHSTCDHLSRGEGGTAQ